jgi:hypothetical protein
MRAGLCECPILRDQAAKDGAFAYIEATAKADPCGMTTERYATAKAKQKQLQKQNTSNCKSKTKAGPPPSAKDDN